jgi:hypothetical protein
MLAGLDAILAAVVAGKEVRCGHTSHLTRGSHFWLPTNNVTERTGELQEEGAG